MADIVYLCLPFLLIVIIMKLSNLKNDFMYSFIIKVSHFDDVDCLLFSSLFNVLPNSISKKNKFYDTELLETPEYIESIQMYAWKLVANTGEVVAMIYSVSKDHPWLSVTKIKN